MLKVAQGRCCCTLHFALPPDTAISNTAVPENSFRGCGPGLGTCQDLGCLLVCVLPGGESSVSLFPARLVPLGTGALMPRPVLPPPNTWGVHCELRFPMHSAQAYNSLSNPLSTG